MYAQLTCFVNHCCFCYCYNCGRAIVVSFVVGSTVDCCLCCFYCVASTFAAVIIITNFCFLFFFPKTAGSPDIVIIDVDSKDASVGMSCPPVAFVSDDFLSHVKTILAQQSYTRNGMLLINLVCRDDKLRADVIARVKKVRAKVLPCFCSGCCCCSFFVLFFSLFFFPSTYFRLFICLFLKLFGEVHVLDVSEEDVNKIVVAFPAPRSSPSPLSKPQLQKQAEQIAACLARKQTIKQDVDVVDIVKNFEALTLGGDSNNNNNAASSSGGAKKKKKKNNKKK